MKSQFLYCNGGLRLHLLSAGDESRPPLVLLHGYPTSGQLWRRIIPPLAERFRVHVPDLPGHGQSDKPTDVDYDLDFFVDSLLGVLDALGLERAGLVAHDLGGMAALALAVRHPERISRLVVMDTAPYVEWPFMNRLAVGLLRNPLLTRWHLMPGQFRRALGFFGFHRREACTPEVAELHRAPWIESAASRRVFSRAVSAPPEFMTEPPERLRRVDVPTLVLWAEHDRLFPLRIARQLQQDIPGASLAVVPDCGHFLQEEQPERITEHLLSFLDPLLRDGA